jgi:hypothetical protein
MAKMETKGGARIQAVIFTGRKKVVVTKREKEKDDKKKNDPKPPVDPISKKNRKKQFGRSAPRPHGLPKRALRLPFGPQVPPDSGFTAIY